MKTGILFLLIFLSSTINHLSAQVTIGSGEAPVIAALLEIKDRADSTGGVTSTTGGLGMPRVELEQESSLAPFIADSLLTPSLMAEHIGLSVYNLTNNDSARYFSKGIYTWDGERWQRQINSNYSKIYSSGLMASSGYINVENATVDSIGAEDITGLAAIQDITQGTILAWGDTTLYNRKGFLIEENGSYLIVFALYGQIEIPENYNAIICHFYLGIDINGGYSSNVQNYATHPRTGTDTSTVAYAYQSQSMTTVRRFLKGNFVSFRAMNWSIGRTNELNINGRVFIIKVNG